MTMRTNNSRSAACSRSLHVESLERRQLLSGIPLLAYPPGKPPPLGPAAAISRASLGENGGSAAMMVNLPVLAEMSLHEGLHSTHPTEPDLNGVPAAIEGQHLTFGGGQSAMTVSVLLGNGDGSFQPARTFTAPVYAGPAVVGDFNRDGIPDQVVVNREAGTVSVLLGNGDGSFQAARIVATSGLHLSVGVGDFNRDGLVDIAIIGRPRGSARSQERRLATRSITPPPAGQGETRRTQTGRAISSADYWFDVADAMRTAAKVTETESKTESQASGFQLDPEKDQVAGIERRPLGPQSEDATATSVLDVQQPSEAFRHDAEALLPTSSAGHPLAGLLSIDLPALERRVDAFFRQVENLAEEATDALAGSRLTLWLVIGVASSAACAFAHRHLHKHAGAGVLARGDPVSWKWAWLSAGAVPPPCEKS